MGAYPVKLWQFSVANLAMIPGILVYVYVGTAVSSIGALFDQSGGSSIVKIIMFSLGLVFGVIAIIVICVYTKKQLNKVVHEMEEALEQEAQDAQEADLESPIASELMEVQDIPPHSEYERNDAQILNEERATMNTNSKGSKPNSRTQKRSEDSNSQEMFKRDAVSENNSKSFSHSHPQNQEKANQNDRSVQEIGGLPIIGLPE